VYQHFQANNLGTGAFATNEQMNSLEKILHLVRTRGPAGGTDPTAVLVLYTARHAQFGHCGAYRAPASGGADWKRWILHDAQLGVFAASDTRAVNHKMWDGILVFYFLRLPAEDGPAVPCTHGCCCGRGASPRGGTWSQ
jgi:hypothetical protein